MIRATSSQTVFFVEGALVSQCPILSRQRQEYAKLSELVRFAHLGDASPFLRTSLWSTLCFGSKK